MSWTDERVNLLKKLWMEGFSASQIAAELGSVTRNAVIGKVHRLGLSGRAKTPSSSGGSRPKRAARNGSYSSRSTHSSQRSLVRSQIRVNAGHPRENFLPEEEKLEAPQPLKLELTQLTEQTCKWPVGDPATEDFYFCGHEPKEGSPYCPYHYRLAYQPVADRRRERRAEAVA
jgi:GcrA cell cycle regulator